MEKETINLIISICVLALSIILFVIVLVTIKRKNRFFSNGLQEIECATKDYYLSVKLDDDLFPYHEKVISGIKYDIRSKGEVDQEFKIQLPKRYSFYHQKVIYIINDQLKYPKEIVEKDGKKFIKITKDINKMEILVSSDKPSHFMIMYEFLHKNRQLEMKMKEVNYNETN